MRDPSPNTDAGSAAGPLGWWTIIALIGVPIYLVERLVAWLG